MTTIQPKTFTETHECTQMSMTIDNVDMEANLLFVTVRLQDDEGRIIKMFHKTYALNEFVNKDLLCKQVCTDLDIIMVTNHTS